MSVAVGPDAIRAPTASTPAAPDGSTPVAVRRLAGPAEFAAWDRYVTAAADGSWFHTTAWRVAVETAFGHKPIYLLAERDGRIAGALPLFLVRSLFGGRMLVSVPYGVYGGAVADDDEVRRALRNALADEMDRSKAAVADLRSMRAGFDAMEANDRYVTFRRELPERPDDVSAWLPRKARAAARHGREKHGLTVRFGHEQLPLVWKLYSASMRRLASLNYPYRFFDSLVARAPDRTLTSVVHYAGSPIGGLLTLVLGDTVMPYFVGLDPRYRFAGVGNFLYLTLMEQAVEMGCRVFDFGRSRRDNRGCCDFKRLQGFSATPLGYQRLTASGADAADLTPTGTSFQWARRVWPHLPMALTRPFGAWLAKHIPG